MRFKPTPMRFKSFKMIQSSPANGSMESAANVSMEQKKKKRSRAAKMMREMRHYQKTERLLVPRQNFENVVWFIGQDLCPGLRM